MNILLVHPPIHDFTAYDFWLRPLGLLRVAGRIDAPGASMELFDFMDARAGKTDPWGRGRYRHIEIPKPAALADVPRRYHRFGRPADDFVDRLRRRKGQGRVFDVALIQATMTWWYPGVAEVVEILRRESPATRIVLGGPYAMLCGDHARGLGVDVVCDRPDPREALAAVGLAWSNEDRPAAWKLCDAPATGAVKLTDGCPFRCTYCSVPICYDGFSRRSIDLVVEEIAAMAARGARDIAFYDDALLARADEAIVPLCQRLAALALGGRVNFHTPNALNARMLSRPVAEALVAAGFKTFYLGFESASEAFQRATGAKVFQDEFAAAVEALRAAGADPRRIVAYLLLGHPAADLQALEASMRWVNGLGVRIMAADFAPAPGTPDGEACAAITDMAEPLNHNKTAFAIRRLGRERINRLKGLRQSLNASLPT